MRSRGESLAAVIPLAFRSRTHLIRQLEVKHLADIMGIKQGAARMQVYRAKSKMHAKGVTIDGVDLAQAAAVAEKTGAAGNRVKGASKRKAKQDDDDADEMSP